ncbi:MAG TPA: hypothetical protein VGP13_02570 [Candidatus Paceibacterota bacterium]|nr:hypothetical protein [Candidatus Paceibacterota bacterium]
MRTLDSLKKRGLAESHKQGKRHVWLKAPQGIIEQDILMSAESLGLSMVGLSLPGFSLIRGADKLTETLYTLLESLPRNGQFSGIQPTRSGLVSTDKIGPETIVKINELIKERGIVVRGVLEEDFVEQLHGKFGREWLKSFAGRLTHTSVVPNGYLQYDADLYIIGESAMLANWKDEVGVVIENKDTVILLKSLYQFMHDSGRRLDNNELAKQILAR